MARQALAHWIREALTAESRDGSAVRPKFFSLQHYQAGQPKEFRTFPVGSKPIDPDQLAEALESIARTHAGGLSGAQQYAVWCVYDNPLCPTDEYIMRVAGIVEAGLETEPPTSQGQHAQIMRHNEGLMRLALGGSQTTNDTLVNLVSQLGGMVSRLIEEQAASLELAKQVVLQRAQDAEEREMRVIAARRNAKLLEKAAE